MTHFNSDIWYCITSCLQRRRICCKHSLKVPQTFMSWQQVCKASEACFLDPHRHYSIVKAVEQDDQIGTGTLTVWRMPSCNHLQEQIHKRAALMRLKRARSRYAAHLIAEKDLEGYKRLLGEGLSVDHVLDNLYVRWVIRFWQWEEEGRLFSIARRIIGSKVSNFFNREASRGLRPNNFRSISALLST